MKKHVLIVAGGSGSRMNAGIPKQFLNLAGKPVLMRTMERFAAHDPHMEIVLALPAGYMDYWAELCHTHTFTLKHTCVRGGENRCETVRNGLATLPDEGLVFIHDGVRPLVSNTTIDNCAKTAIRKGNALPVIPVSDSLRYIPWESHDGRRQSLEERRNEAVDRSRFMLVQTPQTFLTEIIKKAYNSADSNSHTDDASVCEAAGKRINLVEGNPENIKITCPADLLIAEFLFLKEISQK